MVKVCECCGHPVVDHAVYLELTGIQRRIMESLHAAGSRGLTIDRLLHEVYAFDPNGGPLSGKNGLSVQRIRMQKILEKHGLMIKANYPHGRATASIWRLASITDQRSTSAQGKL